MKKIIIALLTAMAVVMAAGCGSGSSVIETTITGETKETVTSEKPSEETTAGNEKTTEETTEAPAKAQTTTAQEIKNEKPVRVYVINYGAGCAELKKTYEVPWIDSEDIGVFAALCADADEVPFNTEKQLHVDDWDQTDTITEYKIGYEVSFDAGGEHKRFTILEPSDIVNEEDLFMGDVDYETVTGYLGVWVYDDYHQKDGEFYVHVSPDEYTDDTLLTSIKLRLTPKMDEVSNLKLKVFSYSSTLEFDADGYYNGAYGYEMSIVSE